MRLKESIRGYCPKDGESKEKSMEMESGITLRFGGFALHGHQKITNIILRSD